MLLIENIINEMDDSLILSAVEDATFNACMNEDDEFVDAISNYATLEETTDEHDEAFEELMTPYFESAIMSYSPLFIPDSKFLIDEGANLFFSKYSRKVIIDRRLNKASNKSPRAGIHATAWVNSGCIEKNKDKRKEISSFIPIFFRKKNRARTVRI